MSGASVALRVDLALGGSWKKAVMADVPTVWYRCSEQAGSVTAKDSSGNGHDGTMAGGVSGYEIEPNNPEGGYAFDFNGTTDKIAAGNVSALAFTGSFTVEAIVKFTAAPVSFGCIASKSDSGGRGWGLGVTAAKKIRFFCYTAALAKIFDTTTPLAYGDGLWHYIKASWDGTNGVGSQGVRIEVNEIVTILDDAGFGTPGTNTESFNVGAIGTTPGLFFTGGIDEVVVYGGSLATNHYLASIWTNVSSDVLNVAGLTWDRGSAGGPLDRTPDVGTLAFTLINHAGNSGHLQGYYSPAHANCRSGFTYSIPVRVVSTYSGTDKTQWTGRLVTIDPMPGKYGSQLTAVTAHDKVDDLVNVQLTNSVAAQVNKTEVQLIQAAIAALPLAAQPLVTILDTASDTIPYAFDNLGEKETAQGLIHDAVLSSYGLAWVMKNGGLRYQNRANAAAVTSSGTLGDADEIALVAPTSLDGTYNRIRVTVHQKHVDPAATTVLYSRGTSTPPVVPGFPTGNSLVVWGQYMDPAIPGRAIGGTDQVVPLVATTDYVANTAADGSGTDITADQIVLATPFATNTKFDFYNGNVNPAYFTTLKQRGRGIYNDGDLTLESYTVAAFDRVLDVDLKYQSSPTVGKALAAFLYTNYHDRTKQISEVTFIANTSATLMGHALNREIGDVMTISETVTGLSSVDVTIMGISITVTPGPWLVCRWKVAPHVATTY